MKQFSYYLPKYAQAGFYWQDANNDNNTIAYKAACKVFIIQLFVCYLILLKKRQARNKGKYQEIMNTIPRAI